MTSDLQWRRAQPPPPGQPPPPASPPMPARRWSVRVGPILIAASCAFFVWLTQRVFVQSADGQARDDGWRADVQAAAGPVWDARAHDFGVVSLRLGLLACVVLAVVAVARRRTDLLVRGIIVVAGANATTQLLKRVVIDRPGYVDFGPNALPSGHVTLVASVVIAAVLVLPAAWRGVAALVGSGWVATVGVATVVSGWHRPSDVVAALLVCGGWAALVAAVQQRPAQRRWRWGA